MYVGMYVWARHLLVGVAGVGEQRQHPFVHLGFLLRGSFQITIIGKSYYPVYIPIMAT